MIATAPDTAVGALRAAVDGLLALDWPALPPREAAASDVCPVASLAARLRLNSCQFGVLNGPVTGRFLSDPRGRIGS